MGVFFSLALEAIEACRAVPCRCDVGGGEKGEAAKKSRRACAWATHALD